MDYFKESLHLHKALKGKIRVQAKMDVRSKEDLSLVYSPGVAEPCRAIADDPEKVYDYTIKSNTVAIVTDGSAVLGLGNIGAAASIPVMEGKAMLFKRFAGIDAFPICIDSQDPEEVIKTVKLIAPVFGGINLEDIAAPKSFVIERALQDIGIPVFHDDQHGTAIVVAAALVNAVKVVGKPLSELKIVINGAGAAGVAIARLLKCKDNEEDDQCVPVKEVVVCDSKGIISKERDDLNEEKQELLEFTNTYNRSGDLKNAIREADVFIGVSIGNLLTKEDVRTMAEDPIILALANPDPEIMPDEALAGGAAIIGTGRSDLPNQVNNVLGFPGIFRGALDARAKTISPAMKLAAVHAIADCVRNPTKDHIIPATLKEEVAWKVAAAVKKAAKKAR
ncbi:MAG: NADP-dependent malic enzyme [Saprospiraceae bacterium]|nr:NADP-dependent malic enzyme [Saprospiraceae bacterium]